MPSIERAILWKTGVEGTDEVKRDFMAVGQAAKNTIDDVASAAKAQASFEMAVARANNASAAFGGAQAAVSQQILAAKASLKANEITLEEYNTTVLQAKNSLALLRAEHATATASLNENAKALTVLRGGTDEVTAAHGRMSASSMILMHSVRSSADSFAAGLPPMMIFSEQLARLGEAAALSGGGTGALGAMGEFMAGPWGIAVLGGVAVLGTIISKMDLFGDEVGQATQKLMDQAHANDVSRQAQERYDLTLEGSIEKERKLNDELEKRIKSQAQLDHHQVATTTGDLAGARVMIGFKQSDLTTARGRLGNAQTGLDAATASGNEGAMLAAALEFRAATKAVADAEKALADAKTNVQKYERDLRLARIAELDAQAKALADPKDAASRAIQTKIDTLKANRADNKIDEKSYVTQLADLDRQLADLGKTAKETAQFLMPVTGTISGHFGDQRPGHIHQGIDIAVPVGTAVKAPQAGVVIESGTLPGYGNVVFIDHGGGTITRLAHLSKRDVTKGQEVAQGEVIGLSGGARGANGSGDSTGPHLHYEVRVNGKSVNPTTGRFPTDSMGQEEKSQKLLDEAARKRAEEQAKEDRRVQAFADATANLDKRILDIKMSNTTDLDALAKIAKQEIRVENDKYVADLDSKVKRGEMAAADADTLKAQEAVASILREQAVDTETARRKAEQAFTIQTATNDNQLDILHLQENLATTTQQRRDLALQMLKIEKDNERAALQRQADDTKLDDATREAARIKLRSLDQRYDAKGQAAIASTRSPLEDYLSQNDPSTIGDKVERAYIAELESVRTGIDDAIDNALGIHDPFLKSLVDLFIQQVLINPIAEALQGSMGSGGGFFGHLISGAAGIFGGGGGGIFSAANVGASVNATLDALPVINAIPFAGGTERVPVGADFWVGDNGRERMRMHPGGRLQVISGPQAHRMSNDNPSVTINSTYIVPERADSRATRSSVARGQQLAIGRTIRKGLG